MAITKYSSLFFALLLLLVAGTIHTDNKKPYYKIDKQKYSINFKDEMVLTFHFGLKRLISSTLWIQAMIESDLEHYKKKDLNNWLYLRFNTILKLDPYFLGAYTYGGLYLSVIKDDEIGAKDIFDRGLEKYPQDFKLAYHALLHYYFELNDIQTSYKIFQNIKSNPNVPFYIRSLMSNVALKNEDKTGALILLEQAFNMAQDHLIRENLAKRIEKIKRELKRAP